MFNRVLVGVNVSHGKSLAKPVSESTVAVMKRAGGLPFLILT